MAERRSRRARWLPPAALTALVVVLAVDLPSRESASAATTGEAGDVKDTHERLDRIYRRLGIRRDAPPPRQERRGCDCKPRPRGATAPPTLKVAPPPALPPVLGYVLIGVVLVAMLLPIVLALRGRRDELPASAAALDDEDEQPSVAPRSAWEVSFAECRRLLAAGQLAEAFAGLHRLTLLSLEQTGTLALDATSTNWDYVRRLSGRQADRSLLSAVTIAAESAVLGKRPPAAQRYEELELLLRQRVGGGL